MHCQSLPRKPKKRALWKRSADEVSYFLLRIMMIMNALVLRSYAATFRRTLFGIGLYAIKCVYLLTIACNQEVLSRRAETSVLT